MRLLPEFRCRIFFFVILTLSGAYNAFSGVSRKIQEQYKSDYENKAIFLKIPIYSERQLVFINAQKFRAEQGLGAPKYKVGDQLRILGIDFAGDEIKFRMGAIASAAIVEIIFKFDSSLLENFPNKDVFDRALQSTFTEGLKYTDIEEAKHSFIEQEFDRFIREIAVSASINRESVLKMIAPQVPAYQDAQRDIENLKSRMQDVTGQLTQSQAENHKLETNQKAQQSELFRLKNANASLQDKIDSFTSQVSKLGDDLRDARGTAQGYQQEIVNIQRSLNIKVESNRDLASQIANLGPAIRKLQKDNETLTNQAASIRSNLEAQQAANALLVADNEELKSSNRKMQETIKTLSSTENSLQKKYIDLQKIKQRLDDFSQMVRSLRTSIIEEKNEAGIRSGKANIYLKNTLMGSLDWRLPANVNLNESKIGEVGFSAESIDSVRLTPEERYMLRTLGERFKVRVDLISSSEKMEASAQKKESIQEIGEREHSIWKWTIGNKGSQDARLLISARLINKNSEEISFFQQENAVIASNLVRQVRGHLQPIPLAVGAVIGFLIFGIVGIFRRSKHSSNLKKDPAEPPTFAGRKEL
jgi:predicted nuclease with TOPRIM domain